jgi:hypothetical protein
MNYRLPLIVFLLGCCFLSKAQSVLKVQNGATIKTTGGAMIILQDINLENDGTISQVAGEGGFKFTGTANTSIAGTAVPQFAIMEIAKTGAAKVSLQQPINIASSINFTSGLIDLNANNISLLPPAVLNGESETSRIIGANGGYVTITADLNNPSSVNPGNLGAMISSAQNMGATVIRRGHIQQPNTGGISSSVLRYYDIVPANNTALNATLRFRYFDAELNGLNENLVVLWKSTDNVNWTNEGFTGRDVAANYVEETGIASFSRWTLSTGSGPLPVQFVLFNVRCESNKVLLNWKTAQEINSGYFEIQRSTNNNDWVAIGTLPAAGNSANERSYSFIDNSSVAGGAFYRIVEVDLDGRKQYTSVNRADCGSNDLWKVWPNPVQQQLFVNVAVATGSQVIIQVLDSKGALVREQRNTLLPGSNQLNVDMQRLPAGMYHLLMVWDNGQTRKSVKVLKQ